jgi:NADH-quinone oxidoreductase subunit H
MDAAFVVVALLNLSFVLGLLLNLGGLLTWVERKQGAVMADRIGANRAYIPIPLPAKGGGIRWWKGFTVMGLIHGIADGLKMIVKEDFTPPFVDKVVYNIAPWFAVIPVLMTFAVIPFGGPFQPGVMMSDVLGMVGLTGASDFMMEFFGTTTYQLQLADLDVGLLFIFAMGGTGIFAAALAGWASNNKWALMGALRSSSQMISYEVFMGLSILGLIVIYGTVNMNEIAQIQGDFFMWGFFLQPHMFFIFTVALMAENKRVPFDMAEAESELVAGYFTEYSAMKMGLFMMAEFIEIAVIGGILTTLFFGAYHIPGVHGMGDVIYWSSHPELTPGNFVFGTTVPHVVVIVLRVLAFLGKLCFFCWAQILIRWTLPKFRYDQIMRLGWKFLLPVSIVNLLVTAIVVLAVS